MIPFDVTEMPPEVVRELRNGAHAKDVLAKLAAPQEQALIAKSYGEDRWSIDGLGRPRLEINALSFHYWGQREGYDCWRDESFVKAFERDNPAARVKAKGTKLQIGWNGESQVRFSKKY